MPKEIIVLAGPNGAGKTTAARALLPGTAPIGEFVNADEIVRGMSPNDVDGAALPAGRAMLERLGGLLRQDRSFAFETTLSGRGHMALLKRAQAAGWQVSLLYLWLASPELAQDRVARRVARGGHGIPEPVVSRRYYKGVVNMRDHYLPLSDVAHIYDNSDIGRIKTAKMDLSYTTPAMGSDPGHKRMTHLSSQEIFKAFDTALEISSRWPLVLLAFGFNPRLPRPGPRVINNALLDRGFKPVIKEEDALQTLLADYPDSWWFAIAQETTGRSDATVQQVIDAVRARTAQHAAQ